MLRPERLLASLNHFRLFVKAKVYQLTKPPPPADPPAVVFNLAIAKQTFQLQQQIIQNQLALYQQTRFLKAIQERFPIVNVFASPTVRPVPAFQPSFFSRGTHQPFQIRTITSNPSAATTVGGYFPRSAFAGYGSPGFARNFSSAKAASFFNSNTGTAAANGPANIFAQYSTRTFASAPKANIIGQPAGSHNSSASLKVGRIDDEAKQEAKREQQCHSACNVAKPGYKLFAGDSKGIFEVVLCAEKSDVCARKPRLVRRVTAISRAAAVEKKKSKPETTDLVAQPQPTEPHPRRIAELEEAMHDIITDPRAVAAEPPDRALRSNTKRKKTRASTTYISIPLDVTSLANVEALPTSRPGSPSAQHLDTSLIRSVEDVAEIYQKHFRTVAHLLRTLKQYGEFEVTFVGCEMRVLFPPRHVVAGKGAENWDREGTEQWLKSVGIDPESLHFAVETSTNEESNHDDDDEEKEENEEMQDKSSFFLQQALVDTMPNGDATLFDASEDSDDDLIIVPSLDLSIISVSTPGSQTPRIELGPAYFRRLQEFLDDVDKLIETSPAFLSGRTVAEEDL